MTPFLFTIIFVCFLVLTLLTRFYLSWRQIRYVSAHQQTVPTQFADRLPLEAHQKAARYTLAKVRFGILSRLADTLVLLIFTLGGGLQYLATLLSPVTGSGILFQLSLIIGFGIISGIVDLPFSYYQQFVLEERFGFNKMNLSLFITDMLKNILIGALIGLPVLWVMLTLMDQAGTWWWVYAWLLWNAFQLLMLVLYPTVIAPLFNRFTPLEDASLKARITDLMERVGFRSSGLFVMDGSTRSAHGNAYFTGFGAAKRVVFFDTLLERLNPAEIEAVLAHELGHFKLKHITRRMIMMALTSLVFLGLLGWLKEQSWFYAGLGITDPVYMDNAAALILFALTLPIFTFFFGPLLSRSSRTHEFEADAFAAQYTQAIHLVNALVKMYEDNAATLTPDPLHSAFYDSHPPASIRIRHLLEQP